MDALEQLKFNIQEKRCPFFDDEELLYILKKNDGDVEKASYECLILKSEQTGLTVSGLTTKDTSEYFKRLASNYIFVNTGVLN